ncbi:uncharacterized protein EI97DRAFT_464898 [Westerdykella ornata]|uniref:Nucleoporin Nup133/Nup155-like C-terminal domain-containing protein n=1 Tax=Westerdykella ornata TaxID=318751 RepID=A0A6A6JTX7_WESOR|nr:uncharacterized protein EI97DRAFT_464898 [Westerdykella ornata]KAF2279695.1 hypothetical protein EI97DRAFT_464898 [Westerdykella ornata]
MFSPEATVHAARSSLRNPRRRQRKDSDGFQQPRRKRSKVSEDTFLAPGSSHVNGNGSINGHVKHDDAEGSMVLVEMPVREKSAGAHRAPREDTTHYLTKNENYSVRRLPSFPSNLAHAQAHFRVFAHPAAGLALALTYTHALAWDYTAVSGLTRVITLPLPFELKPSEPLPLGAIVRSGPANEFGILAVAPSRGKIVFWENVDSAEVRSHFAQRPQGIQGAVKVYSGETITGIVDISHAGYVLVFSTGRLAHLTLRDSQGRPGITTSFLNAPTSSSGSFFSFKGLLTGALRKPIASVKARPSRSKGQMEVITATNSALFQVWDLSWSGQQMFKGEVDVHAEILAALQTGTTPESRGNVDAHVLDFAIVEQQKEPGIVALLALVALLGANFIEYSLLEVDLANGEGTVRRVIPIRNFHQPQLPEEPAGKLLLPVPGHTAFIQFPGAIVVVCLAEPEESPDTQLLSDFGRASFPFQDAIYLRQDRQLRICGSAPEDIPRKDRHSSILVAIVGYGLIQINALPPAPDDSDLARHKVTAKSKLEQATFFGNIAGNILDFSIRSRYTFGEDEVNAAALEISTATLSSSYDFMDKVTVSMEDQLHQRADALRSLITHLNAEYPPLSFVTKWQLLWNAEKLEAASAVWKLYQEKVQDQRARPEAYPESLLVPHMVKCLHERFKTKIRPDVGETDPVRQFFLKDINTFDIFLPWAWHSLRTFYLNTEIRRERSSIVQRLSEGNDVFITSLNAAFNFRMENAPLYGIKAADLTDAILLPGHGQDLLPENWTSNHNMASSIRSICDVSRIYAYELFQEGVQEDVAMKIAKDNPALVKLVCRVHLERIHWALSQTDEKIKDKGRHLQEDFMQKVCPDHIYGLAEIGQAPAGMDLAEEYNQLDTLARLVWDEISFTDEVKRTTQSKVEQAECMVKLNKLKERIQKNFDKYGDAWASAFYKRYFEEAQTHQLFNKDFLNQPYFTRFLRSSTNLARIGWINEVIGEKDFVHAHDALYNYATQRETNVWGQKVELSIAKLSLLCTQQKDAPKLDREANAIYDDKMRKTTNRIEYVRIQDMLYERFEPTISASLDKEAAVELLMAEYGQGAMNERPAHQQLLRQGFDKIVHHRGLDYALLIDVLTLMTYDESKPPVELTQGNEFAFALRALVLSWHDMNKMTRIHMLRLIWKRLCIRDDWAKINNTKDTSDAQLQEILANTTLGTTLKALHAMIRENASNSRVACPEDINGLLGAGCTNGELCTRFASEDLRSPIIVDNLADDEVLQANIENHRLREWFPAVVKAAERLYELEQSEGVDGEQEGVGENQAQVDGPVGGDDIEGEAAEADTMAPEAVKTVAGGNGIMRSTMDIDMAEG